MKYVLLAVLLATLSPAQAGDTETDVDCATHAHVGACQEDDPVETGAPQAFIEPKAKAPVTDCSAYPYVGVCDMSTDG